MRVALAFEKKRILRAIKTDLAAIQSRAKYLTTQGSEPEFKALLKAVEELQAKLNSILSESS